MNTFFSIVVQNLNISRFLDSNPLIQNIKDLSLKAITKFRKHLSIIAIESKYRYVPSFSFVEVNEADIEKEILNLNGNKASQNSDIPTKVIKGNSDIFRSFLCTNFNSSIKTSNFPQCLKLADITPLYKKGKNDQKENYRPVVRILPNLSKIFERYIFKQMSQFFESTLSNQQCGFRNGLSNQQCLLVLLEKWKRPIDRGKAFDALLTDLSKTFDCLDHELLMAKLNGYGLNLPTLRLIHDCLSNRKQRTKINYSYSEWL